MSPKQSNQTAAKWRRTRQLQQALDLAHALDGTRTIPQAAREIGLETETTAYRALAALRYLAAEHPHLVQHTARREKNRTYHTVTILGGQTTPARGVSLISLEERAELRELATSTIAYHAGIEGHTMEHPTEPADVLRLLKEIDRLAAEVARLQAPGVRVPDNGDDE